MRGILVIGATGQLGSALVRRLAGTAVTGVGHDELEITDAAGTDALLARIAPRVVINTSAFHAVDRCEDEPERAYAVNALAVRRLARSAHGRGIRLVHCSTDYVFDGTAARPYREDDLPGPQSAYAVSKLAGEYFVLAVGGPHVVVRSAGLFGGTGSRGKGGNFVETILRRARAGEPLRVVADQVTAPTFTDDLAATMVALLERTDAAPMEAAGVVHATAAGSCSWWEFARAIVDAAGLDVPIAPITSAELAAPAPRPAYSVLENARLAALGVPRPRAWREGLHAYLADRGHLPRP